MTLTRRHTLKLGLGTVASIGVSAGCSPHGKQHLQALDNPNQDFTVTGKGSLKQRAAAKGLLYGAAGNYPTLSEDAQFAALFAQECGILVPENEMKWSFLRPTPDTFDFTQADWLAKFARSHNMLLRGHTLVWHQQLPDWFNEVVNQQNAEQIFVKHIETVVKHYAGQMHSWDVVNEGIAGAYNTGRSDRLYDTPWLRFLGKDYIDLAFRVAAAADSKAMLVYNDFALDYDIPRHNDSKAAVLKLLEYLKAKGTPIHALGIQAHLNGSETQFNPNQLRQFLRDVASMGLKILITELDVEDKNLPAAISIRDRRVASVYKDYLSVVLDEPAVIAVLTWGLSDRYTWLSQFNPRPDKLPVRPLPFDANFNRKLAWNAIAQAFDHAPKR